MADVDFKYTDDYDIEMGRDFANASQFESDVQLMQIILQGTNPDFTIQPTLCATLDDFVGENNDPITALSMETQTIKSIISKNKFSSINISTTVYPTDYDKMKVEVEYRTSDDGYVRKIYTTREVQL